MSDLYAEQLEMQLRFAEEECQAREMYAYERGKADGRTEAFDDRIVTIQKSSTCAVTCAMTEYNRDTWEEASKKQLCESAASELSQYISFEVEEDNRPCFAYPHMTVTATLKVVDLNRKEQTNEQNIR